MDGQPSLTPPPALVPVTPAPPGAGAGARDLPARGVAWRRLATPAAVLALCLLSIAFFWRIVLLRQVLLPGDILYAADPLWQALAPHSFSAAANPLDSDALTEFYPWTALAAQALHRGILPLWNPYAFTGTPFLAAMQPAVLYPVNLILEWFVPPVDVLGLRAIVHLAVALVGTFLFTRRLGLSYPAALLSALAFGLSLPFIVWLEHPMTGAVAWLPWILLCTDRIMATRGSLRWTVALAAIMAIEALAGHGESTAHALLLWAAYALFRGVLLGRDSRSMAAAVRPLLALAVALVLGLSLAGAHLLPVLAQIPRSEAAADRPLAAASGILGVPGLWNTLAVAVIPDFFGNPTWHVPPAAGTGYNEYALYIGVVPLLLAILALLRRRDAHPIFFAAAALLALGIAVRLPVLSLVDDLPLFHVVSNGRLRFEYAFAVAVLAGYGLDSLAGAGVPAMAWRLTRVCWLGVATLAILAVDNLAQTYADVSTLPSLLVVAHAALPVLWLSLFGVLLWLLTRGALHSAALRWAAVALAAADLFALGVGYHTTVPRADVLATPPAVRAVQSDSSLYRVAGLGRALLPATSSLYGLQDVRGYDPSYSADYERFFTSFAPGPGTRLGLASAGPGPAAARALGLMNVKYIFAACNIVLNQRYYRPIYTGSGCVYRNVTAMPRAVLVHAVQWAVPRQATALIEQGLVDPLRTALLDPATAGGVAWPATRAPRAVAPPAAGEARVTRYDLNSVAVDVRTGSLAVLVLADAYAPGWQARIDGHTAPIARADAVFRAVVVPAGAHTVQFSYQPESFRVGSLISAGALAVWLLLLLAALWRGRARRRGAAQLHRAA